MISFARMALLIGMLATHCLLVAQNLPMRTVCSLPAALAESSGLIQSGDNSFWSHNDSGGEAKLYQFDTLGNVLRSVVLRGITNVDWEEITQDSSGNVYVADFGNNDNNRSNLVIYKIPHPENSAADTLDAHPIRFIYPDQSAFPPPDSGRYFDMEAMVALGDSLYLFSKNRTDPFDGMTKCYVLPQDSGSYVARLQDSIVTCTSNMPNCWVTAATISPDQSQLLLLTYGRVFIFSCFPGANFFDGSKVSRNISFSQTEALAWRAGSTVYMTDELLNGILGGKLYALDLSEMLAEPLADLGPDTTIWLGDTLLLGPPPLPGFSYQWNTGDVGSQLPVTTAGSYTLTVTAANGCQSEDSVQISTLLAIRDLDEALGFKVWPNPSKSAFHIAYNLAEGEQAHLQVYDALGRQVESRMIEGPAVSTQTEIGKEWPHGLYWLVFATSEYSQKVKLFKY